MHAVNSKTFWVWFVMASSFVFIQDTGITNASTTDAPLQTNVTQLRNLTNANSDVKAGKVPIYKRKVEVGDANLPSINETSNNDLSDDYRGTATQASAILDSRTVSENNSANDRTRRLERSVEPAADSSKKGYAIHWTVFNSWRVLVGMAIFEIVVYVVTLTVVMGMHSRNRNLSRSV